MEHNLHAGGMHEPGDHRLYLIDSCGKMLEPVAYIEISETRQPPESQMLAPRDEQSLRAPGIAWGGGAPEQMFDFCKQMLTSRDAHDALIAEMMSTLVKQVALMQESAVVAEGKLVRRSLSTRCERHCWARTENGQRVANSPGIKLPKITAK